MKVTANGKTPKADSMAPTVAVQMKPRPVAKQIYKKRKTWIAKHDVGCRIPAPVMGSTCAVIEEQYGNDHMEQTRDREGLTALKDYIALSQQVEGTTAAPLNDIHVMNGQTCEGSNINKAIEKQTSSAETVVANAVVAASVEQTNSFSALVDEAYDNQSGATAVANSPANAKLDSPYMNLALPKHVTVNLLFMHGDATHASVKPSSTKEKSQVVLPAITKNDDASSQSLKKNKKKKGKKDKDKMQSSNDDENEQASHMNSESDEDLEESIPSFITNAYAKAASSSSSEGVRRLSARQRKLKSKRRVWRR